MASTVEFSGRSIIQTLNNRSLRFEPGLALKRFPRSKPVQRKTKCTYAATCRTGRENSGLVVSSLGEKHHGSSPVSGYDVVMKFYSSINNKNQDLLRNCFAHDCYIDDFSFPKPFRGKRETMKFYEQLVTSMGQNVKFCVENVCEGDGYTAAVNWHLEWKGRNIPFTRGCSFYEFAEEGGEMVIRNARILIESPIKPGGIVLTLLKNITFLFDEFPKAAEWFLEKPYAIIQVILRIYGLIFAPFVKNIMEGYLKLLNLVAEFILLTLKIIIKIRSFFSK
ncbi:PREDICTED: uncharacterized protein LOC104817848 [Tarenaya hassleriana]|uniref:uncharacterized protein LOC104817848 n=1 Tax=Tarenaya hassleriana TaxID=28532 RepID=UPI00053C7DF9|nr:PREDICTED: uncharacterized protein LOC104817848 [Tarenaya hassleriana]